MRTYCALPVQMVSLRRREGSERSWPTLGGGSGYIATDFTPVGADTVKFKYKPSAVDGSECI